MPNPNKKKHDMRNHLKEGDLLYGYCNGFFGHDDYWDKTVEAVGPDWVVARQIHSNEPIIMVLDDGWGYSDQFPSIVAEWLSPVKGL